MIVTFLFYFLLVTSSAPLCAADQRGMGGWGSVWDLSQLTGDTTPEDTHISATTNYTPDDPYYEIEYKSDGEEDAPINHKLTFAPSAWEKERTFRENEKRKNKRPSKQIHELVSKNGPTRITLEAPVQTRPGRWFVFTPRGRKGMQKNVCVGSLAGTPTDRALPKNSLFFVIGNQAAIFLDLDRNTCPQSDHVFKAVEKFGSVPILAVYNQDAVRFQPGCFTPENIHHLQHILPLQRN